MTFYLGKHSLLSQFKCSCSAGPFLCDVLVSQRITAIKKITRNDGVRGLDYMRGNNLQGEKRVQIYLN